METLRSFVNFICDIAGMFGGLFRSTDIPTYSARDLTFTSKRELTPKEFEDINSAMAQDLQRLKRQYSEEYSDRSGYLVPVFDMARKPIKPKIKLERCKSCGQNEAEYTYSDGIFKCNYCGSLSGAVEQPKPKYLIEHEMIPLNINEARIKLGYPPLPNAPNPSIKCR